MVGDPHNFGRRVQIVDQNGASFAHKPRSVYWEWLFFDHRSPLANWAGNLCPRRKSNLTFQDMFCRLNVNSTADFRSGYSRIIPEVPIEKPTVDDFYRFGLLLAYCSVFGIQDIHCENILPTDRGFQIVDAEQVLSAIVLPSQTFLLPLKDEFFYLSGLRKLGIKKAADILPEQCASLVEGMADGFELLIENISGAVRVFESCRPYIESVPIRVIIRETKDYVNPPENPRFPFLLSELTQLERGDIPFYFKFIGCPDLFYYCDSNLALATVSEKHPSLDKIVQINAVSPEYLLNKERIEKFAGYSIVYVMSKYFNGEVFESKTDAYELNVNYVEVRARFRNRIYRAERKNNIHRSGFQF